MDNSIKVTHENDCRQTIAMPDNLNHSWLNGSQLGNTANSKLLLIAVSGSIGYFKDANGYKLTPSVNYPEDASCVDFVQHVSPLDPNMSSTACYSPSSPHCNNIDISFNSEVIVQNLLSTSDSDVQLNNRNTNTYADHVTVPHTSSPNISEALPNCDSNLLKEVTTNKYLLNENDSSPGVLQIVPGPETEHEVELLITDQITGISYNISTQEYLVERCLADEQHLLDALTQTTHFLDNDLLGIDDASLKSELSEAVDSINSAEILQQQPPNANNIVSSVSSVLPAHIPIKIENYEDDCEYVYSQESLRRSQRRIELQNIENEEQLLSDVQTISDKPIETRARATLPAHYLAIVKQSDDQYGVIARKLIPKCTQFGPVEGLLVVNNREVNNETLQLLVDCGTGSIHRLDVSDENVSNWMCFVRKANTYSEQNLLLTQIGNSLFYISTVNVMPKQELCVGYSSKYAKQYNLPLLKPIPDKDKMWPCFECYQPCQSSADLQSHLNIHDGIEKSKKFKKNFKRKKVRKEYKKYLIECKFCMETFSFSFKDYDMLKKHSVKHCNIDGTSVEDNFSVICYNCEKCGLSFESEILLEIHNLQHKVNNNNVVLNNLICPKCQKKLDTQPQLIEHVNYHCRDKYAPIVSTKGFKCPICYKVFASDERIQRHVFVHGSEDSKPLKCSFCNKRFLNNSALTCHLKTHNTDQKHFECPMCKESFDQVVQLKLHVSKHCVDGNYTCPHCKKICSEYSVIRKHIRAFHCDRKHCCSYCSKPFPTLDKLRMHLLRHSDHKEFLCADCGKQFKRKDKLKEHAKRMHSEKAGNATPKPIKTSLQNKKFTPKVLPTEYYRFIYKCHACLVGFKRRGMLVNHLAKQHPDISPESVPELNLPILRTTRNYYCQYCDKIYKSSSKRKAHILKNHPGQALPLSNRRQGTYPDVSGLPNPTFSQTVGSVPTPPQSCQWCHKQYASKAKLLQHQRKKHADLVHNQSDQVKHSMQHTQMSIHNQDLSDVVLDATAFKKEIKYLQVSAEELLSESAVVLNEARDDQYYQIISVPSSNSASHINNSSDTNNGRVSSDSRLYLLLTTGNGLVHPPR